MLRALTIENIAVAKFLDIEFKDGFSVLTGKTGAGKSVIMDSLNFLLGGKGQRDLIRTGETSASVSAVFCVEDSSAELLKELGIASDEYGEIAVSRTFSADGRGSARINGKSIPIAMLREASMRLVSMHAQTETAILYDKNEYIKILDSYARNGDILSSYSAVYKKLNSKVNELKDFKESLGEKSVLEDILKFQISEIDKAKLNDINEEEKLERLRTRLKGAEHIVKSASLVSRALSPTEKGVGAVYLLERASSALLSLKDALEGAEDMSARLDEYRCDLIDIAERARELACSDCDEEPEKQLDRIEKRLGLISRLERKYGATIEDILKFRDESKKKLSDLIEGEAKIAELEREISAFTAKAKEIADELSRRRREASTNLTLEVMDTLKYLDMPNVRFQVEIRNLKDCEFGLNKRGRDEVDFLVVTNPGEPFQSLSKIASGGETSRIMLALKGAEAKKAGAGTIIFDEIDVGVSGGTSERIGLKLRELSRSAQVICVTHSPQVSATADNHYLICKNEVEGRAESSVKLLTYDERVDEIARMIGGIEITETQISAAREMLMN